MLQVNLLKEIIKWHSLSGFQQNKYIIPIRGLESHKKRLSSVTNFYTGSPAGCRPAFVRQVRERLKTTVLYDTMIMDEKI